MDVRFTPTRFSAGYDMDEVDHFLDRCDRALDSGDGSVTAEMVLGVRFTPTRFAEAYAMDEVDRFLDEVLAPRFAALTDITADGPQAQSPPRSPTAAPGPLAGASGPVPHSAEQRGFLSRLFGRR